MSDPLWSYVKALLHGDGIDGSIRFVDERHTNWTPNGNAKISTLQKKFGAASLYFDGTGDYLNTTASMIHAIGTSDFAVDFWAYPRDTANANPCCFGIAGRGAINQIWLTVDGSANPGKYAFFVGNVSTTVAHLVSTSNVVYDQFVHIAVTRSANTWRLFVNGVLEATATSTAAATSTTVNFSSYIGSGSSDTATNFFGHISDFRLTVGAARWTEAFTPPTTAAEHGPLATDPDYDKVLLHCHFNGENNATSFTDQKGNALFAESNSTLPSLFTGYIGSTTMPVFGGSCLRSQLSNLYARVKVQNVAFSLVAGDFTIEGFFYTGTSTGVDQPVFKLMNSDGSAAAVEFGISYALNQIYVTLNGVRSSTSGTSTGHFAVVRIGAEVRVYVAGVLKITVAVGTAAFDSNGTLYLIGSPTSPSGLFGYIDDVRYTKGVGRYTGPFTPPTEPFPDYFVRRMSGVVRDEAGNPIARTVRSYRSSDGLFVDSTTSNATTGTFEVRATDLSEHFVVVQDATKNALIYDHIVPVL